MHNTSSIAAPDATSLLARILGDVAVDRFTREYFERTFLAIPGPPDRFTDLLTWDALNELLETRFFPPGTIRMTKDGKDVPPASYLVENKAAHASTITRLSPRDVTAAMKDGATLILNSINTLSAPLRALAEALERVLQAKIQVNLYACITSEKYGFACHYDNHDVLVLQIAGRKHWQVFGPRPVKPYPYEPFETAERPPVDVPAWHGTLTQGDALYLPRGWWHFARPVNEPTMHLSVGIVRPTGRDLVEWLMVQANDESQPFRDSVPIHDRDQSWSRFQSALGDALAKSLARPQLLQTFLLDRAVAGSRSQRMTFSLPWSATDTNDLPSDATIHLATASGLTTHASEDGDGTMRLFVEGQPALTLNAKARVLCDYIADNAPLTIGAFLRHFETAFTRATLDTLLRELTVHHLIVVKQTPPSITPNTSELAS